MSSTGGANVDIALSASAPGTAFTADTYNFLLTLERTAGGVRIDSSIIRSSDSQQFGLISFEDDTPETYSFNRAGFLIGDGLNADQAQFSNIDVSFTEPAGPAPRITSFVGLGGGLWELTLEGAPDTEYEFRSSTTLEFAPGTLVENLTQGDPGDPGSIGGTNNSGVTTNGSGLAVVRLVLTGSPADFVRASTTP
jgi:hypothetical protein